MALLGVAAVVVLILFVNSRYGIIVGHVSGYPHHLETVVPQAFEVIPGERMVAGGQTVGKITKAEVTKDGRAHIVMGLDDTVWPVPSDSVLTLRMGGTIKRTDRFVTIARGNATNSFGEHGLVPAEQFVVPVEYNELFNVFDPKTRVGLQSVFANGGPTFRLAARPLHQALEVAPPVLGHAAAVFHDLGYNERALRTLVRSTGEVTTAIARSNPGLRTLISGAANVFGTLAAESKALRKTIDDAGPAFRVDGHLFAHGAVVLPKVARLADRLNPAMSELDALAGPLNATLRKLIGIEPTAVDTLRTVRRASPQLSTLLAGARTKLMAKLPSVAGQAATELQCIRPFTPDLVSFLQGWGGFFGPGFNEPHAHMLHTLVSVLPFPNQMTIDSKQMHQILPNLFIDNPHPPGQEWNQPWFVPECGYTQAGLDPANDPESGTYDAQGSKLVPYPSK